MGSELWQFIDDNFAADPPSVGLENRERLI